MLYKQSKYALTKFFKFQPIWSIVSNTLFFSLSFCHQHKLCYGSGLRQCRQRNQHQPDQGAWTYKDGGREEQSLTLDDKGKDRVPRGPEKGNRVKLVQTLKSHLGKTTHCSRDKSARILTKPPRSPVFEGKLFQVSDLLEMIHL